MNDLPVVVQIKRNIIDISSIQAEESDVGVYMGYSDC